MSLFDKPLLQVTAGDLQDLLDNQEPEGRQLDYKRDAIGQTDSDKREFLFDVSSFANTQGGCLVFGIDEERGVPTKLVGLGSNIDPDKEILRIEQLVRAGIRPAISGIQTKSISLPNGKLALVMRVPKSWNPPHQVTFQKALRFYARDSNGKYQIEVDELKSIFSLSGTVAERIREFRLERIGQIVGGSAPVALLDGGILVLHVVPFSAFGGAVSFPLRDVVRVPNKFPPLQNRAAKNFQITFDGLLTSSNAEAPPAPQRAYTLVMRTGIVEAVASSLARGRDHTWLAINTIESMIVQYATLYANALQEFGVAAVPRSPIITASLSQSDLKRCELKATSIVLLRSRDWGSDILIHPKCPFLVRRR
jgi:hypothetical protein